MRDVPTDMRSAWEWATAALINATVDHSASAATALARARDELDPQREHAAIRSAADVDSWLRSKHLHLWIAFRDLADAVLVLDDEEAADGYFENIARCLNAVECQDDIVDDWMWDEVTPRVAISRRNFIP